ncbi:AMP-binding protein [Apibacter adventoris]|uniref:AMP-binding protein n=1 Tax=Apibacter adventoris TaxID=1679466 RepID=UPI000CF72585|nr:AMP-binding protein [Apibacter adventoris]PQL93279.1 AMP-dependent synthetase [Apibacter adventoris]
MIFLDFSKEINLEKIPQKKEWQKNVVKFLKEWVSDSEIICTKTSGSTGVPKNIELSKKSMIQSAILTSEFLKLKTGDTALVCMPTQYIAGKMMLVRAWVWKLKLFCIEPTSNPLEKIDQKFTFSAMTPMQVRNSLGKINLIEKLLIGGGQVSYDLQTILKKFNTEIYESFGMTETISHIALKKLSGNKNHYFQSMKGTKIRKNEKGCLCIKPSFLNEEVITHDIINLISDHEFEWLGRLDNVINSGGIKIFPEKVEKQLKSIIDQEFIISKKFDEILGNKVILIIEGNESSILRNKIENFSFENKYEKPKEIIYIKRFKRTPTGKIIRENKYN